MANARQGSNDRTRVSRELRAGRARAWWRCAIQCALTLGVIAGWPRWAADDGPGRFASMGMGTALAAPTPLGNGFRIGVSYYGALALDWDSVVADEFCTLANRGFGVVRVWATWCGPDCDSGTLVNKYGNMKTTQQGRLKKMLQFAKAKGMVIDLTFEPAQFTGMGVTAHPLITTGKRSRTSQRG